MLNFIPNINREGYVFVIALFIISCIASAANWGLGLIFLVLTFFCVAFFRDPIRAVPKNDNIILSPADGIVSAVSLKSHHSSPDEQVYCISIFLSVFNVHVNRIPISGKVVAKEYRAGRFISASLDKSSEDNEKQVVVIETESGAKIVVEQIAGLIARRIVCYLSENQSVKSGERFGIIRFGSRVNVFLPAGIKPLISIGQSVIGGETVLANFEGAQKIPEVELV